MNEQEYTIVDHLQISGIFQTRKLDLNLIQKFLGVNGHLIKTQRREVVMARRYLAYLIHVKLGHTLRLTGEILGGKDHTTMVSAIKRHYEGVETKDSMYSNITNGLDKDIEYFKNYGHNLTARI
jgi:hypothetical protein